MLWGDSRFQTGNHSGTRNSSYSTELPKEQKRQRGSYSFKTNFRRLIDKSSFAVLKVKLPRLSVG